MDNYEKTLKYMAEKLSLPTELLHDYLHNTLPPAKKAMIAPRSRQIEVHLTMEGDGVFYCLLRKSHVSPQTLVTAVDFVAPILRGVYKCCVDAGYAVQYFATNDALATDSYFRTILRQNPDAGVLMMMPRRTETMASVCSEMNRPCIVLDYPNTANLPIYTLNGNNCRAVTTLMERLIALGHTRIALITGKMDLASAIERYSGYRAALKNAGIAFNESLVRYGNWRMDTAEILTAELLTLPDPPTAVVCSNDLSALGAYGAIKSAGLRIPEDISVVGFDDIPFVATIDPPLTTVRQPLESMGRTAASILINALDGNPPDKSEYDHPLELIWRDSIGPAPR